MMSCRDRRGLDRSLLLSPRVLGLVLISAAFAAGCGGSSTDDKDTDGPIETDEESDSESDTETDPGTPTVQTVSGIVLDLDGAPIAGASVRLVGSDGATLDGGEVTTGADGRYVAELAATGVIVAQIRRDDLVTAFERVALLPDGTATTLSRLKTMAPAVVMDATLGGVVQAGRGLSLTVPPGALVDANGNAVSGQVDVHLTPFNPYKPAELAALPVDLVAVDDSGTKVPLASYGVVDVTIKQGGEELNIAPGSEVVATVPHTVAAEPVANVPYWSVDVATGEWVQEGTSYYDPTNREFSMVLTHLSPWNIDYPYADDDTCVGGRVVDEFGAAIPGAHVQAQHSDGAWGGLFSESTADAQGRFALGWRKSGAGTIVVTTADGKSVTHPFVGGTADVATLPVTVGTAGCSNEGEIVIPTAGVCETPGQSCGEGLCCDTFGCRPCPDVGPEICGDGIDNDQDGQSDEACPAVDPCGGRCADMPTVGCQIGVCTPDATCEARSCSEATVAWNSFAGTAFDGGAEQVHLPGSPMSFTIPYDGGAHNVRFWRTGDGGRVRKYVPWASADGSFASPLLPEISFGWQGTFPYIDILADGGTVEGDVVFDFGGPATQYGPDWRWIVGVGGTSGSPGEGTLTITSSQTLSYLGSFDAFASGNFASFQAPSTIVGSRDLAPDGMSFFLLPAGASDVTFSLSDVSPNIPDQHGWVVGLVDASVSFCDRETNTCAMNRCGDGIRGPGEACDDGDLDSGDGCSVACAVEAGFSCTDGVTSVCSPIDPCPPGSPDADGDGTPDACDACPNTAARSTFNWSTWSGPIGGTTAAGEVGGVEIELVSSDTLFSAPGYHNYNSTLGLLTDFRIPNTNPVVRNGRASTNTLHFGQPIADPLLVFTSVGHAGLEVPIEFSVDATVLWSDAVRVETPRRIVGEEGYAIVQLAGVHESVTFQFMTAEEWLDFGVGFGGDATRDDDGDGIPDICDDDLVSTTGCADGTREGFTNVGAYPSIAACAGAWTVPGLVQIVDDRGTPLDGEDDVIADQIDRCGNAAGNNGANASGTGCSAEDVCAVGWTVCANSAAVEAAAGLGACAQITEPDSFYATRQRSLANYTCELNLNPLGANDVYGCGNDLGYSLSNCGPLNRVTDDNCGVISGQSSWECEDTEPTSGSIREAADIYKTDATGGGVLCCRN